MALTLEQLTSGPVRMVSDIVDRYHLNPDEFTEDQAKKIARLAFETNIAFRPQSKALEKFVFDLTDIALLGFVPNTLRPTNVGEDYFGETNLEKFAGAAGTLLGLVPAGMGAGALIKGGMKAGKGLARKAKMRFFDKSGINKGGGVTEVGLVPVGRAYGEPSMLQLTSGAKRIGAGAKRLNPTSILDNTGDYLQTAINQAFF